MSQLAESLVGKGHPVLATADGIRPICKAVRKEAIKRRGKRSQEQHKKRAKKLGSKRVSTIFLPKLLDDTGRSWEQIVQQEGVAVFDRLATEWSAKNGAKGGAKGGTKGGTKAQETHKQTAQTIGSTRVSTIFLPKFLDDTGRSWGQIVQQEGAVGFDKLVDEWNSKRNSKAGAATGKNFVSNVYDVRPPSV